MNTSLIQNNIIEHNATIGEALKRLNDLSGGAMTLFVINSEGQLLGTVTDGDIRRAILAAISIDDEVTKAMHRNFRALNHATPDLLQIKKWRSERIRLLPCLDENGKIRRIVDLNVTSTILPISALLMAGGKGERLRPLTLDTPKPLLKVGEKAIIDYNIEALISCGITDITVSTGYLAHKMREHLDKLSEQKGIKIRCVEENQPLGTIGAAALADLPADGCTLVMNSDLLTTLSLEDMYLHHLSQNADITIATIPYQISVPFAVLTLDDTDTQRVVGIEEKPSYSYFANAGIYIFPNNLLRNLPADQRTDATDLIENAISQGLRVTYFPINGTWIDIGTPADFRQATELMKTLKTFIDKK